MNRSELLEALVSSRDEVLKIVREMTPGLPVYLQKIIERCLAVDLGLRYQNVQQLLEDLNAETFRSSARYRAMARRWAKPAAGAVVVAGLLADGVFGGAFAL